MDKDLQRIDLKVLIEAPAGTPLEPVLTVFDRWRRETDAPSDWVDLADYAHMHQGPRVMMAGKRENIALDTNEPGLGILVQTRKDLAGGIEDRFLEAFRRHLALAVRLVQEPEWPESLMVRSNDWVVAINDRLEFPNAGETEALLRPGLETALGRLFGPGRFKLTREENPVSRFGYRVATGQQSALQELLARASD